METWGLDALFYECVGIFNPSFCSCICLYFSTGKNHFVNCYVQPSVHKDGTNISLVNLDPLPKMLLPTYVGLAGTVNQTLHHSEGYSLWEALCHSSSATVFWKCIFSRRWTIAQTFFSWFSRSQRVWKQTRQTWTMKALGLDWSPPAIPHCPGPRSWASSKIHPCWPISQGQVHRALNAFW